MILIPEIKAARDSFYVSVPMRGLNDFNTYRYSDEIEDYQVSVPMRGLNDFNLIRQYLLAQCSAGFRPHAGFK